jgi:hypothetical protein
MERLNMNTGRNLKYKWTLRDSIDLAINYNIFPDTSEDRIELYNAICEEIDYYTGNSMEEREASKKAYRIKANID